MVTGGANLGRIGVITNRERHPGSFDVVHVKDSTGNSFATRLSNIFVIGKVRKSSLSAELQCTASGPGGCKNWSSEKKFPQSCASIMIQSEVF